MVKNILITGLPGSGKTTLVRRVAELLSDLRIAGFYTQEIREGGSRVGFELVGLDGRKSLLAHVTIKSPHRVGKYGVDTRRLEEFFAVEGDQDPDLVVIDEIGKMECFSPAFRQYIRDMLGSPVPVVATIALRGTEDIERIKGRPDVELILLTRSNRDALSSGVAESVRRIVRRYLSE